MEVNLVGVLTATAAMFVVGALWYMVLFSKEWGEMHGFDKLSKKEQKEMQSQMGPLYGTQILVTFVSAWVLAFFLAALPEAAWYTTAFLLWVGFIVPTEVSSVVFGGTEGRWVLSKIVISIGGSLASLLVGAYVISLF